ncbi:MAG TPA: LCP family protein [Pseudonocardiaceae bacterium]|jgi:LCP family protein required for cell wall assembly|nr:LCP family protein [Pseudonocardiaceae bacterium]
MPPPGAPVRRTQPPTGRPGTGQRPPQRPSVDATPTQPVSDEPIGAPRRVSSGNRAEAGFAGNQDDNDFFSDDRDTNDRDANDRGAARDEPRESRRPADRRPANRGRSRGQRIALNAGKVVIALAAVITLGATGVGWATLQSVQNGLTTDSGVIDSRAGGEKPADGSEDILLVGLDSRTDVQGNPLPANVLATLDAGDDQGEVDTDTMILIHIPNDGSQAVGISIPRDSWVNIPGYGTSKINSAYGDAKATSTKQLKAGGDNNPADVERKSSQAGAKLAIQTVENLTGITIDHYAEVNLYGFDQLSQAIGGVPVCLNHAVNDKEYSGAVFPAGYFTVEGVQALQFVRERHNIPGGSTDLEREARQQAFLASMAHKVLSAGTLTNTTELGNLITAVQKSIVIDSGWDLTDFAAQMSGMSSGNIKFETIPVENIDYYPEGPKGTSAVEVSPSQVAAFVHGTTGGGSTPPSNVGATSGASTSNAPSSGNAATTVDVQNGSGESGLAAKVLSKLTSAGFGQGSTGNISTRTTSTIYFHAGQQADADAVASALGGHVTMAEGPSVPSGQVWVYLGTHYGSEGITTTGDDWLLSGTGQSLTGLSGADQSFSQFVGAAAALNGPAKQGADPSTISDSGEAPPCVN